MNQSSFEDIRPYRDDEMQPVFERLLADPACLDAVLALRVPRLARIAPWLLRPIAARYLRRRVAGFSTIDEFQSSLESLFDHLIETTTAGFSWSGLDGLDRERAYLYVSNHRDIAMDSAFVNYATHAEGFGTVRIAIGDNLLTRDFVSDLMRLNKSFIVQRSFSGPKEQYAAFRRTSAYLHHCIEVDRQSTWIAQREGRAKDGDDRTDPAILKMFYVSQRKSGRSFGEVLAALHIVPVAVSYELDPCAPLKARELLAREQSGAYEKPDDEDLRSIVAGITGAKGRVHVHFADECTEPGDDPDALAEVMDRAIHAGFRLFPTHVEAARRLGVDVPEALVAQAGEAIAEVMAVFDASVEETPAELRNLVLQQYAQPVRAHMALLDRADGA